MKKILCPVDFSDASRIASEYTFELASLMNAHITLINVQSLMQTGMEIEPMLAAEMVELSLKNGKEQLEKVEKHFNQKGVPFITYQIAGFPADEIARKSNSEHYDLIVCGATGSGEVAEIMMGSTVSSLIGRTKAPILVVPKNAKFRHAKNMVYATDFGEKEMNSLSVINNFARAFDSQIHVIHITKILEDLDKDDMQKFEHQFKRHVTHNNITFRNEYSDDIEFGVDDFLKRSQADMLVVMHHKRGFLDRMFHISKSRGLAHGTEIPVLIINEK